MKKTGDWALAMQKMKDKKKLPKKKKGKRGGYRKGAGGKKTGINNKHIGMSVPIKYAELLKAMVKSKIAELRAAEEAKEGVKRFIKNNPIHTGFSAPVKPIPKKTLNKLSKVMKQIRPKSGNNKPNTDYLQKRRNAKLKIKKK